MASTLSVEKQTENLTFISSKDYPTVFKVINKNGPLGSTPTVLTNYCSMPPNGKKTDDIRGIATFDGRLNTKFSKLKLTLTDETAGDVIDVCRNAMAAWRMANNPIKRSAWYQKVFKLEDGTKVHLATGGIENPECFVDYSFEGSASYEAPINTFYKAMYGDGSDEPWYTSVTVPTAKEGDWNYETVSNSKLLFRDEAGKAIKMKLGMGECPNIPTAGVPLTDTDTIKKILQSKWYKESRWGCRAAIQLKSIQWKTARDITSDVKVLYPVFNFVAAGSIVFKQVEYVLPEGVIPLEQRAAILNAALLEGLEAPSNKKRKRNNTKAKPSATKINPDFEREILVSDIEGDEDE